jgi:hypothetical protein
MISTFFSKSKPIHLVVISLILLLVFSVTKFLTLKVSFNLFEILKQILLFIVCLSSVFILDFFVTRNNLTRKNSFKILLYVLFVAMFPETILNSKILISNVFILLALRRLVSLRSKKEIKKKIFDAAFWISIATLFYFWAILFYSLIFAALLLYSISDLKNWIIPFIGILCVAIISVSYMIITEIDYILYFKNLYKFSFDFSQLNSKNIIVSATILFSYGLWALFYYFKNLNNKPKNYRPSFILIGIAFIVSTLIIVISPQKNGSEFIFLFAPLAIIITNYLEMVSERWFKEALLLILIITPILNLML